MRPIHEMPRAAAAAVRAVFCDIDGTITTEGRLTAGAYQALENLDAAGVAVAPVTGRPAGWCDMIARFWPVKGVIGENGAFYYAYDHGARKMARKFHPAAAAAAARKGRFDRIAARVEREVPGAAVSADQPFRAVDFAVDFCEDVPALPKSDAEKIKQIFEEEGAEAKISSIHVNGWFGVYDKLTMTKIFAADILQFDIEEENEAAVFAGDSPNDAPMFGFFTHSCGVANVRAFEKRLQTQPVWVADFEGGAGFRQIADHILASRQKQ